MISWNKCAISKTARDEFKFDTFAIAVLLRENMSSYTIPRVIRSVCSLSAASQQQQRERKGRACWSVAAVPIVFVG